MARGKQTCKILKEIRRQIAEANDIDFVTSECRYKGDCLGTCPKCEAEVRYLEQQLRARSLAGKTVALAGISAGMILMSGCSSTKHSNQTDDTLQGEPPESIEQVEAKDSVKDGEVSEIDAVSNLPKDSLTAKKDFAKEEIIFGASPEISPVFPGGDINLLRFIAENIRYPETGSGVQGRVFVRFDVDTLGNVCDPKILRGLGPEFDQEALRVVKLFPKIRPGRFNGKIVKMSMTVPVTFKTGEDQDSTKSHDDCPPEFPGGEKALHEFIISRLYYPVEFAAIDVEGKVIVEVDIDSLGKVSNPRIKKSLIPELDKITIDVINMLPAFIPAKKNGRRVSAKYTIPVIWRLTK